MANYANLKAAIDSVIKANGQQEITGPLLNQVLKAMVNALGAGYLFIGVAEHDTNPNTPDQNVFYIALEEGTYTYFGNAQVPFGISLLIWYGQWSVLNLVTFSEEVTQDSHNIPTSDAIYKFVNSLTTDAVIVDTLPEPSENTIHKIYCTPVSNPTPLHTKDKYITIYDEIVPDYTNVRGLLTLANVPTDEDGAQIGEGTFIVNVTSTNKAYYVTIVRYPSEYGYLVTSVICEAGKYAKLQSNELYVSNGTSWEVQPSDRRYRWESFSPDMSKYYTKEETLTLLNGKQDVIKDLAAIRSGAYAGATALQPSALTPYSTTEQMNAAIKVESDRAKEAEAVNAEEIAKLKEVVADLETVAEGYVRVAGSSSPALSYKSYKYHEQGGFGRESVFHLFYPCLVGTKLSGNDAQVGKIKFILKKFGAQTINGAAMWEDLDGNFHAIDGTEGDVMICNIEPYFRIKGKHPIDGTEYDVYIVSRIPFTWQGIDAEEVDKNGLSPDYCVSHTDTDNVVRMHSVYNPAWNGSYSSPAGVVGKYVFSTDPDTGDIVETYDANVTLLGGAGGLHSTDIDLPNGEQRAMNMNPDTTKPVPFYNHTAGGVENMFVLMLAEGGTFDAHNAARMGSGFSSNDAATSAGDWEQSGSGAKNGVRVMDKDGAWKYHSLSGNVRYLFGETSGTLYAANIINAWRNPWHIMEAHRAVSYAVQNDIHELEWFVFEGNKYKYRSVQGFNTPAQGEMTCVVWKMIVTQAGPAAIDPTDLVTSIAGNRVEILVSTALFHGMTTQVSPSWWTSGLIFTEDEDGVYNAYMERDQSQLIKSEYGDKYITEQFEYEQHYKHVGTYTKGEGYRKNYNNDALMLPDTNANKSGGGLHTYVGAYNYFTGVNAPTGKKSVRGFRRGNNANVTFLSPLCVAANLSPSYSSAFCAFGTCCQIVD